MLSDVLTTGMVVKVKGSGTALVVTCSGQKLFIYEKGGFDYIDAVSHEVIKVYDKPKKMSFDHGNEIPMPEIYERVSKSNEPKRHGETGKKGVGGFEIIEEK